MLTARKLSKFERRLKETGVPVLVKLWDGQILFAPPAPRVQVTVKNAAALSSLAEPSMGKLARSYVEEHIDVEGSARDVLRVTEALSDGQTEVQRSRRGLHPWVVHTRVLDRKSVV